MVSKGFEKLPRTITISKPQLLDEICEETLKVLHKLYENDIFLTSKQVEEWEEICFVGLREEVEKFMLKNDMEDVGSCLVTIKFPVQRRSFDFEIYWSRLDLKPILEYIYVCCFAERLANTKYEVGDYFCKVVLADLEFPFRERNGNVSVVLPEEYTSKDVRSYGKNMISFAKILKFTNSYIKSSISDILKNFVKVSKIIDFVKMYIDKDIEINSNDQVFISSLAHRFRNYTGNASAKAVLFYNPIPKKGSIIYMILFKNKVYYCLEWRNFDLTGEMAEKIRSLERKIIAKFSSLSKLEVKNIIGSLLIMDKEVGLKSENGWNPRLLEAV